jgi:hypothetical protein
VAFDRIRYHDPLSIGSNGIAKLKKGSGVGWGTHTSDWDAGDQAAEKIKLQRPHMAVEEIIHISVGYKA